MSLSFVTVGLLNMFLQNGVCTRDTVVYARVGCVATSAHSNHVFRFIRQHKSVGHMSRHS